MKLNENLITLCTVTPCLGTNYKLFTHMSRCTGCYEFDTQIVRNIKMVKRKQTYVFEWTMSSYQDDKI